VGELVPPFRHAAQVNVRQVAELGLSNAHVTNDRNVEIGHLVFGGTDCLLDNLKSVFMEKVGLEVFFVFLDL
jgi:hypothetical protein